MLSRVLRSGLQAPNMKRVSSMVSGIHTSPESRSYDLCLTPNRDGVCQLSEIEEDLARFKLVSSKRDTTYPTTPDRYSHIMFDMYVMDENTDIPKCVLGYAPDDTLRSGYVELVDVCNYLHDHGCSVVSGEGYIVDPVVPKKRR